MRTACWSLATVSGFHMWYSPSRRHWYCPPLARTLPLTSIGGKPTRCRSRLSRAMTSSVDALDPAGGAGEVLVDQLLAEADGFEDLGAAVALHRGDAHLRRDLDDALVGRLDVVLLRLLGREALGEQALLLHVRERLERDVGVDRPGAVADQQAEVVHLAGLAGLDDQPGLRARALADEVVVDGRRREQARDRGAVLVDAAVGEDQDRRPVGDRLAGQLARGVQRPLETRLAFADVEQDRDRERLQVAGRDLAQLLQVVVRQDRRAAA